jgi:phage repressor protein C with HTH and peptisase S24 domain
MDETRITLDRLIRDRGEDYAALSRLIGRNLAYIQQYIHRGIPKKLAEEDRRTIARYFGVADSVLGGPVPEASDTVSISRLDVAASAGPGAVAEDRAAGRMKLDAAFVRSLGARPEALSVIRVTGDSMEPTLSDGDDILVNRDDGVTRLRDGIYVLRADDVLIVKRVIVGEDRQVSIHSDNPAWAALPAPDMADVQLVGRVVWVGRRLA